MQPHGPARSRIGPIATIGSVGCAIFMVVAGAGCGGGETEPGGAPPAATAPDGRSAAEHAIEAVSEQAAAAIAELKRTYEARLKIYTDRLATLESGAATAKSDQVTQLVGAFEQKLDAAREYVASLGGGGGGDPSAIREKLETMFADLSGVYEKAKAELEKAAGNLLPGGAKVPGLGGGSGGGAGGG